ncbi:MAG TPA: TonB-dependent receptor [Terriglobales bacterium]|nr:TonB-dependent receptor [Terriglobales bacterium]
MRRLLGTSVLLLLFAVAGYAQTFRGAINGTVTDPSGAVVPNANVKAVNNATGVTNAMTTTSNGQFAFQDLPLGSYKVSVSASGFRPIAVDNVIVTAGSIYTLPVKLALGQESTSIEVSAAALAVDTTTQTQTMTIPSAVVQDVPLNGRDFTQLISVEPGFGGYNVGGFGSLNGTRPNQVNWQIDGVDNNDLWHNIPAVNQGGVSGIAGIILPIDSIDEFSAQTQSGAEAGRNAGGTVNVVMKSGGNAFHGSVYYYNRNEFYAASSPFFTKSATVTKAPPLRNQNYGLSVGGPIIKNKTFFFLGYEKQQYLIGLSGLATEPSDAWIANAQSVLNKFGVPESSLSANLIGPNGFWPKNLIGNLPATTHNFFSPVASTGYSYNADARIDHNFTENERLSFRWFGGQGSQTAPLGGSPALGTASSNLKDYFEVAPLHVYNYALVWNSVFSTRLTNQVLFGVNYFNQVFHDFNNKFDTKSMGLFLSPDAKVNGQPIRGAPQIVIGDFEHIGLTPPEGRNDITGHLTDIVSYTMGKHQFRFGGEVRQGRVNEFYFRRGTGQFTFDGSQGPWASSICSTPPAPGCIDSNTAALADFLAGNVLKSTIAVGNAERAVTVNAFNAYIQDAWQVTRKLNLNYGLRYEYFGPLHSGKKDLGVFIPGKALLIQGNGIDSIFPPDRNNFAPRLGFAYQPRENGDLVVRGGIGVFFDQINMNPFLDFRPPITAASGLQGNPVGPSPYSTYTRNGYNWQAVQAGGQSIFPGVQTCPSLNFNIDPGCGVPGAGGTNIYNVFGVNQNFRAPYFYSYNLQLEKALGNAALVQIGYVGNQGRKLNIMLNLNQNGDYNTLYPNVGSILQLNSSGTSNYNGLQSVFRVKSWHGLTSQFAYTWAHSLDEISEYRAVIPFDSFNLHLDYGNSDYDTRHLFTTSFTYDIPGSSHGPKILTHGWQLSSLLNFHSGQPYDITRPGKNLIGDPFAGVSHSFSKNLPICSCAGMQWVNPLAFASATGPGNLSRNKFAGPGFGDVDLSVFKNIPITERFRLQLRAEMFNLFNRINLVSGAGAVNSDGTITDTIGDFNGAPGLGPGEPFNMQLAIKIIF